MTYDDVFFNDKVGLMKRTFVGNNVADAQNVLLCQSHQSDFGRFADSKFSI